MITGFIRSKSSFGQRAYVRVETHDDQELAEIYASPTNGVAQWTYLDADELDELAKAATEAAAHLRSLM